MDLLRQLQIFVTVAENGSFARAADALRMSRPGITNAVAALETSIGVRLLHRTTRRTSLTGEGEILHERATQLLGDVDEIRNLFGRSGTAPRGRLRVDVPVALARPILVPHLPAFSEMYPGVDLILGVSDQPVDLIADGVDCVLRIGDLPSGSMIGRVVAQATMVTCAAPEYLAAQGVPRTVEDLAGHRAVTYFSGRGRRTLEWNLSEAGQKRVVKLRSSILVNDTEAFVACALAGYGLIQAAGVSVAAHLDAGRLVEVLPHLRAARPLSLMYPNRQYLAPQVRAFIDWVDDLFETIDSPWLQKP